MTRLREPVRLVIFDLDGTLTKVESTWQYVHEKLGTWDAGKLSAEDYWKGKIDYVTWAELDSYMWRGVKLARLRSIVDAIPYVDGARETIAELRRRGKFSGIVSAGISLLSDRACKELVMDFAVANELHVFRGRMTGVITVNVSLDGKPLVMKRVAESWGCSLRECAVVGDNNFDLPSEAGLRIAFNPRDANIAAECDVVVKSTDIRGILPHIVSTLE